MKQVIELEPGEQIPIRDRNGRLVCYVRASDEHVMEELNEMMKKLTERTEESRERVEKLSAEL